MKARTFARICCLLIDPSGSTYRRTLILLPYLLYSLFQQLPWGTFQMLCHILLQTIQNFPENNENSNIHLCENKPTK